MDIEGSESFIGKKIRLIFEEEDDIEGKLIAVEDNGVVIISNYEGEETAHWRRKDEIVGMDYNEKGNY
jgi:hypothetical protein